MGQEILNKDRILSVLRSALPRLQGLGLRNVALAGSFARDEAGPDSDIDLLVEFQEGRKTFDSFMDVCDVLESLFPRKVHVLTPESLSPYFAAGMRLDQRHEVAP